MDNFLNTIISCDIIIFDTEYSLSDAGLVFHSLSTCNITEQKTFICISPHLTWTDTPKTYTNSYQDQDTQDNSNEIFDSEGVKVEVVPFTEKDRRKRIQSCIYA